MPHALGDADTIVAPSTAPGFAARAIVRLSGPDALRIAGELSIPAESGPPAAPAGASARETAGPRAIDAILRTPLGPLPCGLQVFRAPRSMTRQDVVEFHVTGHPALVDAVVEACRAAGARLATPGEFTRRAFLNGRIDLSQAEGVLALVRSADEAERRAAVRLLEGDLARVVRALVKETADLCAETEAALDFSDHDLDGMPREELLRRLAGLAGGVAALRAGEGTRRRSGGAPRVALWGRPNVGKSSLFNALVGRDRAIVSPAAGTTRDTLEAESNFDGLRVVLTDAAGHEASGDDLRQAATARALQAVRAADFVLWVVSAPDGITPEDRLCREALGDRPFALVVNKVDAIDGPACMALGRSALVGGPVCWVSALRGDRLDRLRSVVAHHLRRPETAGGEAMLQERHRESLTGAAAALERAREALQSGAGEEFAAADLRRALDSLGAITGDVRTEDLLEMIFSKFCVGK